MGFSSGGFDVGTAIAYLDLNTMAFNRALEESQRMFQTFADDSATAAQKWQTVGQNLTNFGTGLTQNVTLPLANLAQNAIQSYRDYESAFAGVKKTVELTEDDMSKLGVTWDDLSNIIVKMAQRTASSSEEIAGVMEIAGQLGVPLGQSGKDIEKFTETMVMLGDSTNLSAAEAADALARFENITGGSVGNIDRLGSAVVSLGNNFATNEDEIVMMSTRLASAGTIAGLSETEILALATAMTSVGIKAEAGGTAMSQTLSKVTEIIAQATDTTSAGSAEASEKLNLLAKTAGMTSDEFVNTWKNEPIEAISAFIGGLGKMSDNAEETVLTLDELGFTGIRQSNMLRSLALSSENMASALDVSNKAYEENTALSDEANKRYETMDSRINQLNERWKEMKRDLAEILIPILEQLMDILGKVIDWWMSLDEETKQSIVNFALFAAAIGPVLVAIGNLITSIGTIKGIMPIISSAFGNLQDAILLSKNGFGELANAVSGTFKLFNPAILAIVAGVAILIAAFIKAYNESEEVREAVRQLGEAAVNIFKAVGEIFQTVWALISPIIGAIVDFWSEVIKILFPEMSKLLLTLSETILNLAGALRPLFELVGKVAAFIIETLKPALLVTYKILGWLIDLINSLVEIISGVLEVIIGILTFNFDLIKKGVEDLGDGINDLVVNFTGQTIEKIGGFFSNVWSKFTGFISDVWGKLIAFTTDVIGKTSAFLSNIISNVGGFISDVVSKVVGFFADIISKIVSNISTIVSKVVGFFSDIIGRVASFISDVLGKLGSFAGNVLQKAITIGSNLLNGIWGKIKEIPGKVSGLFNNILNFLSGLYNKFFGSGQNMFQGLWNGLKSIWDSIWGWLQGIWDKVTGFFSNLWGTISGGVGSFFNGSHANGLTYVPYNGYIAQLHEGERVLTKQEARDYNNDKGSSGGGDIYNFYNTKPDPYEYSRQMRIAKIKQSMNQDSPSETSPIYV